MKKYKKRQIDKFLLAAVGSRIRASRLSSGHRTLRCLAGKIDVAEGQVSSWENGHRLPSAIFLIAIADACNVSVDFLLGRAH